MFYPDTLPSGQWLDFYAQQFTTVEINASFYRLPSLTTAHRWCAQTPSDFVFALKASRFITHRKRLRAPHTSLRRLLAVARALGGKCGPILFQLPPRWRCNLSRLIAFLEALPRGHDCVFEFRDASWHNRQVYALLRRHRAAFCVYHLAGFESPHVLTADFAYLRLHGSALSGYGGSYTDTVLGNWAQEIRGWKKLRRVYVYFDNDEAGYAVRNAQTLQSMLTGGSHAGD